MKSRIIKSALIAGLAMAHCAVHAEDIDLFVGGQPGASERPNVLFIIDNTANWTAAFENEKQALVKTFNAIPVNDDGTPRFNVGVMFAAETSSSDSNVSGGYVRAALRPMTGTATVPGTKHLYADMIAALDVGKDKGNGGASSLLMAEAYRYFSAAAPYAGNNKAKADYTGNTGADWSNSATTLASLTAMQRIYALPGNALPSKSANRYNGLGGSQCGKNYIIYISNGPPQDSNQYIAQANSMLAAAGGDTTQIPLSPTGSQNNVSDEWSRFMKASLGVVTYAIDVDPSTTGQAPGWSRVLRSMSEDMSGGKYISVNSTVNAGSEISDAVGEALSEIQAVNSVFASVSLPVSANTQGTFSNQVYIGMFRPHANAYPRWSGNLKQYQLGHVNGVLRLVDADADAAINPLTGFITECARSFWTPTTTDTYWSFRPGGECISTDSTNPNLFRNSNSPDGNIVEKGAHAYVLRSATARTLKTCAPGACSTLTNFTTGNTAITAAQLGVSATERDALIDWARGRDIDNEDSNTGTTIRASVHADVVHSRPVAIDFGTSSSPKVVVFYGGNDGVFRAINGNQSASIDEPAPSTATTAPGGELWGFVPPEFYGQFKRLRDNSVQIDFPNVAAADAAPKPYGIDGPITASRGGTTTSIFATMRRGGRALYAFDVANNNPANVTLKWRKGCPQNFPVTGAVSDTGCDADFSGIGQTWSAAKPLKAAGYGAGSSPLLILGGGYDTCEDSDPHTCTSSSKGNKVYVLDANDGSVVRAFDTDRSVIADATIVPDSTTGLAKYAYTADLGGNVYRVTFGTGAPADWTITRIASLGCATTASCPTNRKFMFAPDVLDNNGEYVLLLGSGDREKPLLQYGAAASVTNYFFMLRDRPNDGTWLATESANCSTAVLCLDSLLGITTAANPTPTALAAKKGWYLGLRSTEQVVTSAITIFGTVTFSTHTPDAPQVGVCTSKLGTARVYNVSFLDASSQNGTPDRSEVLPPDTGLPPSPVAGMVDLGGDPIAFCIGCGSTSSIEAEEPPLPAGSVPTQPKGRVYWYIER
jgi:type IV pilus assembly protein PilY1